MHVQRDEVALGALQERLELLLWVDGFGRRLALYRAHFWLGESLYNPGWLTQSPPRSVHGYRM